MLSKQQFTNLNEQSTIFPKEMYYRIFFKKSQQIDSNINFGAITHMGTTSKGVQLIWSKNQEKQKNKGRWQSHGYKLDRNREDIKHPIIKLQGPTNSKMMKNPYISTNIKQHHDSLFKEDSDYYQFIPQDEYQCELMEIISDSEEDSRSEAEGQTHYRADSNNSSTQSQTQGAQKIPAHAQSHVPKKKRLSKSARKHLNLKRNRGPKTTLQLTVPGYWTKNFLQFGKKAHFHYLEGRSLPITKQEHRILNQIKNRVGISMDEYEAMYNMQGLKDLWQEFFASKYLFRSLMVSRVEKDYRIVFVKFIDVFEKSFRNKKFQGISSAQ